jgi:hypothetical protein
MADPIRKRIVETRAISARELQDNAGNWRMHPKAQKEAMQGILAEIGETDTLKAYYSERNSGALTLIDGHLRRDVAPDHEWDVSILDLTDEEADYMLAVYDTVTGLAEADAERVTALLDRVTTDNLDVREMLRRLEVEAHQLLGKQREGDEGDEGDDEYTGPAEMELLPYEHYDYVVLFFTRKTDWSRAQEVLGLERRVDPRSDKARRVGLCRVLDGRTILDKLTGEGDYADTVRDTEQGAG